MRKQIALTCLVLIAACGPAAHSDSPGIPTVLDSDWYVLRDPVTGRTFRCHRHEEVAGYNPTTEWCYDPEMNP
jgi:hypothetical protein